MNTAIYGRVSTEEQANEGYSIRAQEQKLTDFAKVKDWSIYSTYIDEGISGKNITARPEINRLIDDIKAGHVKNVLVFKLDRLTRNVGDLVYLMDLFREHNCAFNSLTESIDTSTASGRMFIKIIGIFAEFERENIGERVRVGKERKAREGFTTSSWITCYGFEREKGEKVQRINEAEAENVRMVFDMFVNQGMSLTAISRSLNMQKITTKRGFMWNAAGIKAMLTNCNYMGFVRYATLEPERYFENEGKHEAIISKEMYDAAQVLIAKNCKTHRTKRPNERNYFVNFLYCDICGDKYLPHEQTMKSNGETVYSFRCRTRFQRGNCNAKAISAKKLEVALVEYFSNYVDTFNSDSAESERLKQEEQNSHRASQIRNFQEKLRYYDEREKQIVSHYANGEIEFEGYMTIKKQISADRAFVSGELANLTADEDESRISVYPLEVAASFCESWQGLTDSEKRLFLTKFIKKIHARNDPVEGQRYGKTTVTDVEFNLQ